MAAVEFEVSRSAQTFLWDFGWFDLTHFRVKGTIEGRESAESVVQAFFRSPVSHRSFCKPHASDPWGVGNGLHGPFLAQALDSKSLAPIDRKGIAKAVDAIIHDPEFTEPPSAAQLALVTEWLTTLGSSSDVTFRLAPPAAARDDIAFIWLLFHEFVSVSPDKGTLTIAVFGFD